MATENTLHIKNNFPQSIAIWVPNSNWNCCDFPTPGTTIGVMLPNTTRDLNYCRTDGHGCNGEQGEFALSIAVGTNHYTLPLSFDSNGAMSPPVSITGVDPILGQRSDGTYILSLSP